MNISTPTICLSRRRSFALACALAMVAPLAQAEKITVGDRVLDVGVAQSRQEHTKGLQGVKHLPDTKGMLFVFEPTRKVCFWMKGTPIDLDVGFFDENDQLVKYEGMQANMLDLHCSPVPVRYALEVPSGWYQRYGISITTKLRRAERIEKPAKDVGEN